MKVSLFQVNVADDEPFAQRMDRVLGDIVAEQGRDLIVLPELWAHGGFSYDGWGGGEALDGPILSAIAQAARQAQSFVHAGGIVERNPNGRPFNTAAIFNREGRLVSIYRKIHLFGFDEGEAVLFQPGTEIETTVIDGVDAGIATCFDLRFPELFRAMTSDGARLFIIPAAWPARRIMHWRQLLRARAIENQAFLLGCATSGVHAGKAMGGYSAIISPTGEIIAEASADKDEILRADIDLALVTEVRRKFPVLEWRRVGPDFPRRKK